MTETKFTPGPWYCGSDVSVLCDAPSGDLNSDVVNLVALVYSRRSPISGANVVETNLHANRSLIAAAPDLYEALKAVLIGCEEHEQIFRTPPLRPEVVARARSAISKAHGEAE